MSKNYAHIMDKITGTPWIIHPDSLSTILSIVDKKISGETVDLSEYTFGPSRSNEDDGDEGEGGDDTVSGVGMLNIIGPLFPRANMMMQMSGASSVEKLRGNFSALVADPAIKSIILNIDSPGGMSDLIMEFGDDIYSARGTKPIVAVSNTNACSAAFWLGTQADKFYVTPSGQVGSLGVYTVHQDKSAQQEKEGISTTLISAGKYKVEGSPYGPLSDDTKQHMQERVNETYAEFVSAVARGRGVDEEVVKESYGEGRTYRAKTALAMNMVDGVQTLDSVVGGMMEFSNTGGGSYIYTTTTDHTSGSQYSFTITTNDEDGEKMEFNAETLEALGLSEDATAEEVNAAVVEMANAIMPTLEATEVQRAFAEQFPEQAALLEELRERDIAQSAQLFSESYAKFSADSAHGFSSVALEAIENAHKQISADSFTHNDLKSFLDLFSAKSAIVDYTERGTSREAEMITAESSREAATQIATLARAAQAEAGGPSKLSWGDALAQVENEHPELMEAYHGKAGGDE